MKVLYIVILLIITLPLKAQEVTINGNAATYKGDTLYLHGFTDYLSFTPEIIASALVDEKGDFMFRFTSANTRQVYISLEVFKGFMFVEPGGNYTIILPQKQIKNTEDQLNPFFKQIEFNFSFISLNDNSLNKLTNSFDKQYSKAVGTILNQGALAKTGKRKTDSIINNIEQNFKDSDNEYFNDYKYYYYGMLQFMGYKHNKEDLLNEFFKNKPVKYNNISYMLFFDEVFSGFFTLPSSLLPIKNIYSSIYDKSYYQLYKTIQMSKLFTDNQLIELVILKGLKDAYYSESFEKEPIIAVLDSFILSTKNPDFLRIAENLRTNFTKLVTGYTAPPFMLPKPNGKMLKSTDFIGKFLYIQFFNPLSYTSQQQMEVLKTLKQRIPENFEIVTIFVSKNKADLNKYLEQHPDYNWNFVFYDNNNQLLTDYKVKAYPMYYLVNPDGKLILNPAPSPTEDIEVKYILLYNDWKTQQIRNQNKNKGIGTN